jgi:predicted glycosyltransferase
MTPKVMIWVQHLLGFGHFMRAKLVAEALAADGMDVVLVSGGPLPGDTEVRGARLVRLPPVRAKDVLFDDLVDDSGQPPTQALMDSRRDIMLDVFRSFAPDCVITETFPFGRRLLQAELLALVDELRSAKRNTKLVASVRDVVQRPRKANRAEAMVVFAAQNYHAVLVHSDPKIVSAEASFPEMAQIRSLFRYTGYICRGVRAPSSRRDEVLISAGGGAVGRKLIAVAEAARDLTQLRERPWTIVMGPLSDGATGASGGVTKVRSLPDFPERLAHAAVSVSQAGYNTITEALIARTPTVAVPFETDREQEQITRARGFAARGLLTLVRECDLTPDALAKAMDLAHARGMADHDINLDGQAGTVAAVREILSS